MNNKYINSKNSKTSDPHKLLLNLTDKIDLGRKDKYIALSNLSIYDTWKNIKTSHKSNKLKILVQTWNEELELPDGSYLYIRYLRLFSIYIKNHGKRQLILQ